MLSLQVHMIGADKPWVVRAWSNWHRPWAMMHVAWLDSADAAIVADVRQELVLRMHYTAWCEHYALVPTLVEFDDTPWWQLFSLPSAAFEMAARRVGGALMYAAAPRLRLATTCRADLDATRWALERAQFISRGVCAEIQAAGLNDSLMRHAVLALQWCLKTSAPGLWDRMRRRFPPGDVQAVATCPAPGPIACGGAATLWSSSTRRALLEIDR
jgi:hypothetical protein